MKIHDIMTKNPSCVTADSPVRDAAQLMLSEDVGIVPVVDALDRGQLIGVITDRDIAIRCVADGRDGTCRVSDAMSTGDVKTCSQDDEIDSVIDTMRAEQVRRIPIIDERGSLVGIVSQADILLKTYDGQRAEQTIEAISKPGGAHTQIVGSRWRQ
ncbi:MAG TPA: CBS domain-containing protein [Gemmatimonadaceae bacterium]|nr:CBS domain-containing protein [Gemmatimonadaceae bacterium]